MDTSHKSPSETVGAKFQVDLLRAARDKTLQVINETAKLIRPGMKEQEARALLQEIQTKFGAPKSWHPPQIRFGENTLLPFGKLGASDIALTENDIFFLDIGPIFDEHEGDVGRAFSLGDDSDMKRCCSDVEKIWHEVRDEWAKKHVSGRALYQFATDCAQSRGWVLSLQKANGHRIADFPHAAKMRSSIEEQTDKLSTDRWILEIQIQHPDKKFGAFFEDLLN
jgi:Xaa-Pro aminopeptidase